MTIRPRSHLAGIEACFHGSFSEREGAERGIAARDVVDFSASCNPLGASPRVLEAMRAADPYRYPDDDARSLRAALAERVGVDPSWVAVGNGSVEIIYLLATAYLEPGERALVAGPTFGEYSRACRTAGARVMEVRAREEDRFRPDPAALAAAIRAERPKLAFLCNPNNPTGQLMALEPAPGARESSPIPGPRVSRAGGASPAMPAFGDRRPAQEDALTPTLSQRERGNQGLFQGEREVGGGSQGEGEEREDWCGLLLEGCEETLLVVDEAYLPFCDVAVDLRRYLSSGRLLLLRSLTKDHGLAGLRLGYAISSPDVLDPVRRVRPPWSVNALAQAAGLAALDDAEHVEAARGVVSEARAFLATELSALGLGVIPSAANFLLVRVADGAAFRSRLLERGVCVRDCASFGLPAYVRIGVRRLEECRRLVDATKEVIRDA